MFALKLDTPYGHAKVTIGHHNSGHYGKNRHFRHFSNGHMRHQHGHAGYPVKEQKNSSEVLYSYQFNLPF